MTWSFHLNEIGLKQSMNVEDVLTVSEQQIRQEEILSRSESTVRIATAMGVLPFDFTKDTLEALGGFSVDKNWLDLYIEQETVLVGAAKACSLPINTDTNTGSESDSLPSGARFILLQDPKSQSQSQSPSVLFIYYCPENTPIRQKMTMSAAKVGLVYVCMYLYMYS